MARKKKKVMGRPPFDDSTQVRSDKLSITLTGTEKNALKLGAKGQGMTASTFTRQAVLTDPAVVEHLDSELDLATIRLLAHDWLNRTEHMAEYFDPYLAKDERKQLDKLLNKFRERVEWFEKEIPI